MTTEEINAIANATVRKELEVIRLLARYNGRVGDAARLIVDAVDRVTTR